MDNNSLKEMVDDSARDERCCKNCKHWGGMAIRDLITSSRYCKNPFLQAVSSAYDFNLPTPASIAVVSDDDAILQTGPEFGCNQWDEKIHNSNGFSETLNNVITLDVSVVD